MPTDDRVARWSAVDAPEGSPAGRGTCTWTEDADGTWGTACGEEFLRTDPFVEEKLSDA